MHRNPTPASDSQPELDRARWFNENRMVASVVTLVGAIGVFIALVRDESFGAEATIALIMFCLGVIGLLWPSRRN